LKFEGEYLNGKRSGKGKEYNEYGNLFFKGEYLYDYRIKGKEYNKGKIIFEGEYIFDKKWNGKGYDENGNIIYELHNGKGNIKEYYKGKLIFEGEYLNGLRHGKGKEYDSYIRLIFEGEYVKGKDGKEKDIIIRVVT